MSRQFLTDIDLKSSLLLDGAPGVSGYVLKSQGAGQKPIWAVDDAGGAGSVSIGLSAADVLTAVAGEITADDAGSDKLVFWDDSAGKLTYASVSGKLSITDTTVNSTGMQLLDTQTYSASGTFTWNKPAGALYVSVIAIGGGGGGASGGASANTAVGGNGGGSAGAFVRASFPAVILADTETVVVGGRGVGGASRVLTAAGSNAVTAGINGGPGGDSKFGRWILAEGGNAGIVNTSSSAVGGGGAAIGILAGYTIPVEIGGAGGDGAATDNNPTTGAGPAATVAMSSGGGAGGGGGATATAIAAQAGAAAGSLTGGTVGTSSTTQGSATSGGVGNVTSDGLLASGGGGGGNCATSAGSATAGAGGDAGGAGAGGGGGGAARVATTAGNVATSGKGGDGGLGRVVVYTYG